MRPDNDRCGALAQGKGRTPGKTQTRSSIEPGNDLRTAYRAWTQLHERPKKPGTRGYCVLPWACFLPDVVWRENDLLHVEPLL
jgi:hypothetical protein